MFCHWAMYISVIDIWIDQRNSKLTLILIFQVVAFSFSFLLVSYMRKWKCFITGQRNSANYSWIMFIAQHQSRDLWLYGDRLLCNFMPFNFKEGISSQDVFVREICTIISSEITHTPPQKSNGRPLSSVY